MQDDATKRLHNLCNWSGICFIVFYLVGMMFLAGFVPPPSPALSMTETAAIYDANPNFIRLGAVFMMLGASLFIPFACLIARFIIRIERGVGVLSMMQIMAGLTNMLLFFYPCLWWLTAGFRLERSPELIQALHDAAWIQFAGGLFPFLFQLLSIALASFIDKSEKPVFPRWFGFLNLWTIVLYLPGQALFFFKTGPFAWNGIFAWGIPATTFTIWTLATFFVMRKALDEEGCPVT